LTEIPLVHREQANLRPKLGPSFEEFFERATEIPVEEGGLFVSSEDGPRYTEESVAEDAQLILRVEKEVEHGGLLAEERCSVFEPEPEEEPPRLWAHMDHLTKAMTNFRKLMLNEQQRHRGTAKRLAIACEAEWRRRNPQPKTAEEIELEEIEQTKARWRHVNKAMAGTWDNIKAEVNRQRLADWEAEEQRRVKAALNQAVNASELKLQARQARLDTEELSDEELDEDDMLSDDDEDVLDGGSEGTGDMSEQDGDDEDNMSSSGDEEDKESVLSDEGLTQEQLREKYANLPALDVPAGEKSSEGAVPADIAATPGPDEDDTSDESIDMDDDMGSSDEESSEEEEEEEGGGSDDDESEGEPGGLLGLLFGKSELKKLKEEATEEPGIQEDVEMVDAGATPKFEATAGNEEDGGAKADDQRLTSRPSTIVEGGEHSEAFREDSVPPRSPKEPPTAERETGAQDSPAPTTNGVSAEPAIVSTGVEVSNKQPELIQDVSMVDASDVPEASLQDTETEVIPVPTIQHPSPETEPITNVHSPSRSQSPRASDDTKPTDIETPSSLTLLNAPKTDDSRSASPLPAVPRTEIPFLLRGTLRE
jgi:helicase SWR1